MLEAAVIGLRWLQFSGAVVLLGVPLFLFYGLRPPARPDVGWTKILLGLAALAVALGSVAALVAQTAVMAGSLSLAVEPETLSMMVTGTSLGAAILIRAGLAVLALSAVAVFRSGPLSWGLTAASGVLIVASFAWSGHGAATEGAGGRIHLAADIVHLVAAALWLGALVALAILLARRTAPDDLAIHRALRGFSGIGTMAVALLVMTGLVNAAYLVGPSQIASLGTGLYGQLLIGKLGLFAVMLALAAGNRFHRTPAMGALLAAGEDPVRAVGRLRRDVTVEAIAGTLLLGVVAWMGTLAPPSTM